MRRSLALILTVFLAGCGGAPTSRTTPTLTPSGTLEWINVGRITLTEDTCLADIPGPAPHGRIAVTVVNQRAVDGSFTMFRIAEGYTFADAKAHANAERHLVETGQPFMGPP